MIIFILAWMAGQCLFLSLTAHAETGDVEELSMPEVVVTATRFPVPSTTVPAPVTVLTYEDIQRTPFRDGYQVDDLLRYVPEVQPSNLSSRYNHPTAQAVSLRGLGNRRTLVLLDGIPLNDGFGGWINWGLVPDNLRRIEIVPGGSSNLYGTWAMGGVIHLLTDAPSPGSAVRAESRAGTLSTYSDAVNARYGNDRIGLSVDARWFHTNGFIPVPGYQRGPIDRTDDSRHEQFRGTFRAALDSRTAFTLTGQLFREDRTFGTPLSVATRTIGGLSAGLEGETSRGDQWDVNAFAQWQTFRNLTSQITPSPLLRLSEFRDRIQVIPSNDFGGRAQYTMQATPTNRVAVGGDARAILAQSEEQIFVQSGPIGRTLAEGKQVGGGLFVEWVSTTIQRLTVTPSIRMDWWKNFDGRIESVSGTVTTPRDNVETALNPKFALQYAVTDRVWAGASFYQAFRAPTLNELYRGFSFSGFQFLPNENLSPERLTGGDAKLEADLLPNRRLTLRIVGHHDEVRDQILFVTQNAFSARRQNVGRTKTNGGDIEVTARPHDQLSFRIGYAYADSTITSFPGDPSRIGKQVPNVSHHQVTAAMTLGRPDVIEFTLMGRYLSRQYADDLNTQPIADFVVLDAALRKQVGRHWTVTLDTENLTDRHYIATQTGAVKTLGAPLLVIGGVRMAY